MFVTLDRLARLPDRLGQAPVDDQGLAIGAEHDVAGLDVAVQHPPAMCVRHRVAHADEASQQLPQPQDALAPIAARVLRLVMGRGAVLVALGLAIGFGGAAALTRFLKTVLYGVSATDPVTFGAMALLLAAVALTACVIPARRAARVDPAVALRSE